MDHIWLVLAMAVVTYITRIGGFAISRWALPPAVNRFLGYIPIAAFAALIVPGVSPGNPDLLPRLIGITVAVLVVLRWPTLWVALATGMTTFWLAAWLLTGGPG